MTHRTNLRTAGVALVSAAAAVASAFGQQGTAGAVQPAGQPAPQTAAQPASQPAAAPGADTPLPSNLSGSNLSVTVAPYLWLAGMYGTFSTQNRTASVSSNFWDVVQDSDSILAFMGAAEVRYGKLGAFIDGAWMNLGVDNKVGPLNNRNSIQQEIGVITFGAIYQVGAWPLYETTNGKPPAFGFPGQQATMDVYAGGRWTSADITVDNQVQGKVSDGNDWVSPIVGARVRFELTQELAIWVAGDIGGFNVGSEFEWNVLAALQWEFPIGTATGALLLGYRALSYEYQSNRANQFAWDMTLAGPVLGFGIKF